MFEFRWFLFSYVDVENETFEKDKMELNICSWDCPEEYP